jgi:GntR family transcriptional regulator
VLLDLSDQSSETLQQQIIRQVRARILTGELVAGEALPSIRGMARQLRVSVITVDRAYDQLSRQGLISSRRGKGYFVSEVSRKKRTTMARERLDEQLRHLVRGAVAEGLSPDDIRRLLEDALGDSDGD